MQTVVSSNYNSAQNAFIQHFETEASFKQWASFSSVSYSSFGDIRMGKNRQHGYEDWGLVNPYSANSETAYFATPSTNSNPNIQKNSGYSQVDFLQICSQPAPVNRNFYSVCNFPTPPTSRVLTNSTKLVRRACALPSGTMAKNAY